MTLNCGNVQKAIDVMERARRVRMSSWQQYNYDKKPAQTEQELNICGTAACFAGHLAVAPEFQAQGVRVGERGQPVLGKASYEQAVAELLGISVVLAQHFVFGALPERIGIEGQQEAFYDKPLSYVTREDVLKRLRELQKNGYCEVNGEKLA